MKQQPTNTESGPAKEGGGRIPLDVQHVITGIHQKYTGIISMMTQENAALQATVDNAETIILEQDAEIDALKMEIEDLTKIIEETNNANE